MWLDSSVPVIFDFRGVDEVNHQMLLETGFGARFQDVRKEVLWLLECRARNL
jgi:hypothetical protein